MKLEAVRDVLLVKRDEVEDVTDFGLIITEKSKDKLTRGVIVSAGPDVPETAKEGTRIYFTKYGPNTLKDKDVDLLVLEWADVIAIIQE